MVSVAGTKGLARPWVVRTRAPTLSGLEQRTMWPHPVSEGPLWLRTVPSKPRRDGGGQVVGGDMGHMSRDQLWPERLGACPGMEGAEAFRMGLDCTEQRGVRVSHDP